MQVQFSFYGKLGLFVFFVVCSLADFSDFFGVYSPLLKNLPQVRPLSHARDACSLVSVVLIQAYSSLLLLFCVFHNSGNEG